jgi:hypothetical protein
MICIYLTLTRGAGQERQFSGKYLLQDGVTKYHVMEPK